MEPFVIGTSQSCQIAFHSPEYADDGWLDAYTVELRGQGMHAAVRVENPGFGQPPSQLLQKLASSWAGWNGSKVWHSVEGELLLEATADRTGHITLSAKVEANSIVPPWSVEARVIVEAGQLEALARKAEAFFARRSA